MVIMECNLPQTPTRSRSPATTDICRICHCEGETDAPLISPCYCAGSLHFVHQSCLQQWIKNSNIKNCELCKFQFVMQTKIKPFYEWEKLHMSRMERHKLFCSVVFHLIALICVLWSLFVLIDRTADEIYFSNFEWPFWTKLVVVAVGLVGGLLFMYLQCKMYVHLCRRWHNFNRVIYVQSLPSHERQQNSALNPLLPNQKPLEKSQSLNKKTDVKCSSEALDCV